ncbi:MAG: dimethylmenaquinone methyltransferase [Bryobacterales bacterium]|nr:dimethylmenaquinone methyltransferase [Bryobacterales bacterium]
MTNRLAAFLVAAAVPALAQMDGFSKAQVIKYTPDWTGERLEDGRPKVSDALLDRLRKVHMTSEEAAWGPLRLIHNYMHQWEGNWKILNPEKGLVGRAFTVQFMPGRPEVSRIIEGEASAKGLSQHNVRMMDMLRPGDVMVVDMAGGRVEDGVIAGDNLAVAVWARTGNGFVVNGSIRDQEGIEPHGFPVYCKGVWPGVFGDLMMTGINVPIRIGEVTVMPGDVVVGDREGVTFVPPHVVEEIAANAEIYDLADEWRMEKFISTKGQVRISDLYGRIAMRDPALQKECAEYVNTRMRERGISPVARQQWEVRKYSGSGCYPRK